MNSNFIEIEICNKILHIGELVNIRYGAKNYSIWSHIRNYNSLDKYIELLDLKQPLYINDINRIEKEKINYLEKTKILNSTISLNNLIESNGQYEFIQFIRRNYFKNLEIKFYSNNNFILVDFNFLNNFKKINTKEIKEIVLNGFNYKLGDKIKDTEDMLMKIHKRKNKMFISLKNLNGINRRKELTLNPNKSFVF